MQTVRSIPEFLAAIKAKTTPFTLDGAAAELVSARMTVNHRPYSPLAQIMNTIGSSLPGLKISADVGGREDVHMMNIDQQTQAQSGLTAIDADLIVQAVNHDYQSELKDGKILLQIPEKPSGNPNFGGTDYSKYLKK
ncbi:hypothetical protein [Lacticaseibacillus zhaodongensis]|uniref:hypothetical protein n=1 Tax=Lacticaseibacillus zhaodongensis TaxID=2668065 RepID=UPI0012D338BE|nr:hypothetical protein [Lacticaseibacillus zhaodongensis]